MNRIVCALAASSLVGLAATPAAAQFGRTPPLTDVPHCSRPIGSASIAPPADQWWTRFGLSNPEQLIKLMAQRSGCLRIVDRGAGLQMRSVERGLGGELQRGSNIGAGQIKAADFTIVPDVADANANQGGLNGGPSSLLGSRFGGLGSLAGNFRTQQSTARALLTLVNVRTTEQEFVAEGTAQKMDLSLGGNGFGGALSGVGGGYSSTSIGQVISQAYLVAFTNLVSYMQGAQPGAAEAAAPIQSYVASAPLTLRALPATSSRTVRSLQPGDSVYPTGQKNGVWWEVDDENGNRGWVVNFQLRAK